MMAVAHAEFETLDISSLINGNSVVYNVKGVMDNGFDGKLYPPQPPRNKFGTGSKGGEGECDERKNADLIY